MRSFCLSVLFSLLFIFNSVGQSGQVLSKLSDKMKAMGAYHAEFVLSAEGNDISGEYTVSDGRSYLKMSGAEVVFDGKDRFEVNHDNREVVIDHVSEAGQNIIANPVKAFDFADEYFVASTRSAKVGGKDADVVSLTPKDESVSITFMELSVDRASGLPLRLVYSLKGFTEQVVVNIRKIHPVAKPDASLFRFDRTKYPGYEIVDFR